MSERGHWFHSYMPVIFLLLLSQHRLIAGDESRGTVAGKAVELSTLRPLPGVTISLPGTQYGAICDSTGFFVINGVPSGNYNIKATAVGYKPVIKTDIVVSAQNPVYTELELQENVRILNDITVMPDYFQGSSYEPLSYTKLGFEEIRRTPGSFEDVIRTISVLPGIAQSDQLRNDLIVRGGGPSENLFIVDGFIMPSINHFASQTSATGPSSYINLDLVENASFSTGGFSSMHGDKASSVLQLNLRDARRDRIGGKLTLSALMFSLSAEGPLSKKTSFIFSLRRSYLDILFRSSGFVFVPEFYDLNGRLSHKFSANSSVSLLFLGSLDNVKLFDKQIDPRKENPRAMGSNQKQFLSGLSYRLLMNNAMLSVNLSRFLFKYATVPNMIFDNTTTETENTLKTDLLVKLSSSDEITLGATARIINFSTSLELRKFATSYGSILELPRTLHSEDYYKAGGYINYNKRLPFGLAINAGIRGDYFEALKYEYTLAPRLSLSLEVNTNTRLSLSGGTFYQTPAYIWLHTNKMNRRLKSIRSDHFVAGIEHRLKEDMLLKVESYYKIYSDYPSSLLRPYLVMINTGAGFSGTDDNFASFGLEALNSAGKGYSKGIELMVQKKSSEVPHYGIFSLSYSKAGFQGNDGVLHPGSYDQRIYLNLVFGYVFNSKWQANLKFRYGTGKPYTPFGVDGIQKAEDYNITRFPASHQLDLRFDRRWEFSGWHLITYLDIQNIYNRKNISFIRWDYKTKKIADDPVLGIAPSFGITVEI